MGKGGGSLGHGNVHRHHRHKAQAQGTCTSTSARKKQNVPGLCLCSRIPEIWDNGVGPWEQRCKKGGAREKAKSHRKRCLTLGIGGEEEDATWRTVGTH